MAHLQHSALRMLRDMTIRLSDFNIEQSGVCRRCAMGKNTKVVFPSSDNKSERLLDLIHSDLSGPMSFASLTGFEYYITFIDDFSRKTLLKY